MDVYSHTEKSTPKCIAQCLGRNWFSACLKTVNSTESYLSYHIHTGENLVGLKSFAPNGLSYQPPTCKIPHSQIAFVQNLELYSYLGYHEIYFHIIKLSADPLARFQMGGRLSFVWKWPRAQRDRRFQLQLK